MKKGLAIAFVAVVVIAISLFSGEKSDYSNMLTLFANDQTLYGNGFSVLEGEMATNFANGNNDVKFTAKASGTFTARITAVVKGDAVFEISVNGNALPTVFVAEKRYDKAGKQITDEYEFLLNDSVYSGVYGYVITLKQNDVITLRLVSGEMKISKIRFLADNLTHYSKGQNDKGGANKTIQAENYSYKTSSALIETVYKDVNAYPLYLSNEVNAVSLNKSGDSVSYNFNVKKGSYKISLLAYGNGDVAPNVSVEIDGRVPFGQVATYPLYGNGLQLITLADTEPYAFNLSEGNHEIKITKSGYVSAVVRKQLAYVSEKISETYLNLKKLVGNNPDANRDYAIEQYFPNVKNDVKELSDRVYSARDFLLKLGKRKTAVTNRLDNAGKTLYRFYQNPNALARELDKLTIGTDSIIQAVSSATADTEASSIVVDRIFITPHHENIRYKSLTTAQKVKVKIKEFASSFSSKSKDDDAIDVWVNRPLQNVDVMQRLANEDFTKTSGIKVRLSVIKDEGKLVLASASGVSPDGVVGISSWLPYELGLRNLIAPLNDFSGAHETLKNFSSGAMLPLVVNGQILGFPETQDANLIFYRTDILKSLNLKVPKTWDDVITALPTLNRNGMSFYLPTSSPTASKSIALISPYIYQQGGKLYDKDGFSAVNSEEAIKGFSLLTDFYTLYGVPLQVASFVENFKSGAFPIGIGTLSTYSQLKVSAPEIIGKWDVAVCPGIQRDGKIDNTYSALATCASVLKGKNQQKAWQFIRWWLSEKTQVAYAEQCERIWGDDFIWASANLKAFSLANLQQNHKQVVLDQWQNLREVARVPGWYMIERELSNAFSRVVLRGENVRLALEQANETANHEIKRKFSEFGFMKGDKWLKPYKITTVEDIERWKQNGIK